MSPARFFEVVRSAVNDGFEEAIAQHERRPTPSKLAELRATEVLRQGPLH
ncbi:hypothetical protein HTIA_2171 [Halorhabdus tiamatea SARL4B]|nr:hypothetical protein HTIA_2171 [Halorhabdus tiamatea SARL4B]